LIAASLSGLPQFLPVCDLMPSCHLCGAIKQWGADLKHHTGLLFSLENLQWQKKNLNGPSPT
jgi:hypothetical protein